MNKKLKAILISIGMLLATALVAWMAWWLATPKSDNVLDNFIPEQEVVIDDEASDVDEDKDANDADDTSLFDISSADLALQVTFDQKTIPDAIGSFIEGEIVLLVDGNQLNELPSDVAASTLTMEISGAGYYGNGALKQSRELYFEPHIYSPQAGSDRLWFKHDTNTAGVILDFSNGYAEFGYVYGGIKFANELNFDFTTELKFKYNREEQKQDIVVETSEQIPFVTSDIDPSTVSKGDFYYDVEFEPSSGKLGIECKIKMTITSRDSVTGEIDTNLYQRVEIFTYPIDISYVAGDTTQWWFEEAGEFLTGFEAFNEWVTTIQSRNLWIGNRPNLNVNDRQDYETNISLKPIASIDLINGIGEIDFYHYGKHGSSPYVTFVVRPVAFSTNVPTYNIDLGQSNYRIFNITSYPRRPEGYTFLYKEWYKNDSLTNEVYTITTLPVN